MLDGLKIAAIGVLVVLFAMAANYGQDLAYQVHALILMAIAAALFVW
jgi:cytochrome c oxidase cbb3-type subunit 1